MERSQVLNEMGGGEKQHTGEQKEQETEKNRGKEGWRKRMNARDNNNRKSMREEERDAKRLQQRRGAAETRKEEGRAGSGRTRVQT